MGNIQSTPPSTTTINKRYDVFLNFRGEDTRYGFTNNLYKALCDKQIETFIDDQLKKGDTIGPNLSKTISESKISVVIFSEDYASSTWCLRELVEIMKCKKMDNQTVMPVFYNVAPSDVRKQAGSFKDGFDKHEKQFYEKLDSTKQVDSANVSKQRDSSMDSFVKSEKEFHEELQKWREALKEACEVAGYDSSGMRTEAGLVEEIVGDIEKKLMSGVKWSPSDFTGLVGHEERIEQVMRLLCLYKTDDIRIIGIWGMGGIGKTTIADAIFKKISYQFQGTCFIKNVREKLEKNVGLESLQEEFLSKVLSNEGNLKLDGPTFSKQIKEMLKKRKVLIVLDDADDFIKLKDLAGSLDQFGPGSRIMITSRDKQVLKNCTGNDHNICEVKGLDYFEAHKLFCDFAFQKDNHPTEDFNVLSTKIVNYAKGNPLALKVLGSSLFQMSKENWESAIANLQKNFNGHIFNVLKVSYDGLNREERNLFLDIACFFQGNYEEEVANIYGKSISFLLSVLKGKALITVSQFRIIEMHDLLQEMGREIVDNESHRVGKRSRLWRQDDVLRTLTNDDGTNEVQGIILHMDKMEEDIYLNPRAFEKMKSLKFLKLWSNPYYSSPYKVLCLDDLIYLSNELRYLYWSPCPLKVLPSNFKGNNFVQLDLSYSNIERLWEDIVVAPNLKWLILFKCQHLTSISNHLRAPLLEKIDLQYCLELFDFPSPDERGFKQLRELNLQGCTKLKQLPSIIHCQSLRSLILSGCRNLTRIPDLSDASLLEMLNLQGCESLPVFPQLAQNLQILHELDLSNCKNMSYSSDIQLESCKLLDLSGCNNLTTFPQISENVTDLDLSGIAIYDEFPSLLGNMTGLLKLVTLPNSICNLVCLTQLDLSNCSNLKILPENLVNLKLLESLSVDGTAIRQLPYGMRHLNKLRMLSCCRCRGLAFTQFSSLPCSLIELYLSDCHLKEIPEDIGHLSLLLALDLSGSDFESLPVSFKQSNLLVLYLDNCNMLQSLTGIPSWLEYLSASGCKQLRSITDVPDLARLFHAKFTFTNSLNLEQTAVSNILEQLIKENIEMQDEVYGFQKRISFFCLGSEVPGWFDHQNDEPWIQFRTKWYDHVKGEIVGFAVCAVIEFKEYNWEDEGCSKVHYGCWCSDEDKSSPHNITDAFQNKTPTFMDHVEIVSEKETLIDSDHVLLRIRDVAVHYAPGNEYTKYFLFKFRLSKESSHCRVKSCGVHPIYKKHNITLPNTCYENFGATDQDFGETSIKEQHKIRKFPDVVKTSGRSNEDVMEPHPKRFCS